MTPRVTTARILTTTMIVTHHIHSDTVSVFYVVNPITSNFEGTAGRAIYFTVCWQPSEIHYVGIDGKSPSGNDVPQYFDKDVTGDRDGYGISRFRTSHTEMGNLLYKFSQEYGIKFYNLGEGLEYNMSSEVSEKLLLTIVFKYPNSFISFVMFS